MHILVSEPLAQSLGTRETLGEGALPDAGSHWVACSGTDGGAMPVQRLLGGIAPICANTGKTQRENRGALVPLKVDRSVLVCAYRPQQC